MLISFACNYDPDDEYYYKINLPAKPDVTITINDQDTIIAIWQTTICNYHFSSMVDLDISAIEVFIDDELIVSSTSSLLEFAINPEDFSTGHHTLKIKTQTNSGSRSLADRVGAERFVFAKEWDLFIENRWPDSHCITEIVNDNGLLKITWQKYGRINFQKYELYRSRTTQQSGSEWFELVTTITDSSRCFFYDSTYVGGVRAYIVNVTAGNHTVSGDIDSVNFSLPKVLQAHTQGSDLYLTFSKCLFPAAFKEYRFYINHDESFYDDIEKGVIEDLNDTTFVIHDLSFGTAFSLKLATHPININYGIFDKEYEPMTKTHQYLGDTSFIFSPTIVLPPGDAIYFMKNFDGGSIYKYFVAGGIISEVLHMNNDFYNNSFFHISPDGNYLVYSDAYSNSSRLFSLPGMTEISINNVFNLPRTSCLSNNGLAPVLSQNALMIYDFVNQKCLDTVYTNYTGIYPGGVLYGAESYFSPDGEYLYVSSPAHINDTIYHRSGNNFLPMATLSGTASFVAFSPVNPGELIYYDQQKLIILDYKTMTIKQSYTNIHPPFSNIDPVTGYIMANDDMADNIYEIYNIANGSIISDIRIAYNAPIDMLKLYNSMLYSSAGYKIPIIP